MSDTMIFFIKATFYLGCALTIFGIIQFVLLLVNLGNTETNMGEEFLSTINSLVIGIMAVVGLYPLFIKLWQNLKRTCKSFLKNKNIEKQKRRWFFKWQF